MHLVTWYNFNLCSLKRPQVHYLRRNAKCSGAQKTTCFIPHRNQHHPAVGGVEEKPLRDIWCRFLHPAERTACCPHAHLGLTHPSAHHLQGSWGMHHTDSTIMKGSRARDGAFVVKFKPVVWINYGIQRHFHHYRTFLQVNAQKVRTEGSSQADHRLPTDTSKSHPEEQGTGNWSYTCTAPADFLGKGHYESVQKHPRAQSRVVAYPTS